MQRYQIVEEYIPGKPTSTDYLKASIRTIGLNINGTSTPVIHIPTSL